MILLLWKHQGLPWQFFWIYVEYTKLKPDSFSYAAPFSGIIQQEKKSQKQSILVLSMPPKLKWHFDNLIC